MNWMYLMINAISSTKFTGLLQYYCFHIIHTPANRPTLSSYPCLPTYLYDDFLPVNLEIGMLFPFLSWQKNYLTSMKKKKNEHKDHRSSSEERKQTQLPKEKFNTGSHTPPSLRNVGPGYDDTGKGDYAKSKEFENKKQWKNKEPDVQ